MALPMVHLAVAYKWANNNGNNKAVFYSPEFYLGAISPDAIHSRPNINRDDKSKTHFYINSRRFDFNAGMVSANEFLLQHSYDAFGIGYVVHAVTDYFWIRYFSENFPELFDENGKTIPELYYNDTDQVDYMLYAKLPYRQFMFDMMEKSVSPDLDGLLTKEEIEAWKQRTLHWFENECPSSEPIRILTYEKVCYFIDFAPAKVDEALKINENIIYQ